jgi:hypothetical protein
MAGILVLFGHWAVKRYIENAVSSRIDALCSRYGLANKYRSVALDPPDKIILHDIEFTDSAGSRFALSAESLCVTYDKETEKPRNVKAGQGTILYKTKRSLVKAEISGISVEFHDNTGGAVKVGGSIISNRGIIYHPWIARDSVRFQDFELSGNFTYNPEHERLDFNSLVLELNKIKVRVNASVINKSDSMEINLETSMDTLCADDFLESLPQNMTSVFKDAQVQGLVGFEFCLNLRIDEMDSINIEVHPYLDSLHITSLGLVPPLHSLISGGRVKRFLNPESTKIVNSEFDEKYFLSFEEIPHHLAGAILVAEDVRFLKRRGFAGIEYRQALIDNLKRGFIWRGGSTITQQLVKNLYLGSERTLCRKFQEIVISYQMEKIIPRQRIFEIYLNMIEWGPGIYGIGSASKHFFGRDPIDLNPLESAYLASIIRAPNKYYFYYVKNEVSQKWMKFVHKILYKMYEYEHIDFKMYQEYINKSIIFSGTGS